MTDSKIRPRDPVAALLDFSEDCEETADEARQELLAQGVDVDGFLSKVRARLAAQAEAERTAWLVNAREQLSKRLPPTSSDLYGAMDRASLLSALKARPAASAYFHKLETIEDEDLRTLLADLDDLDGDDQDPT
jgi:hypothetical protein